MYKVGPIGLKDFRSRGHSPSLRDLCYYLVGKSCRVLVRFPWPALPSTVAPWVRGKLRSEWSNLGHKVQSRQSQVCARGNEPRRQRSLLQPGQWRWITCVKALEVQEGGRALRQWRRSLEKQAGAFPGEPYRLGEGLQLTDGALGSQGQFQSRVELCFGRLHLCVHSHGRSGGGKPGWSIKIMQGTGLNQSRQGGEERYQGLLEAHRPQSWPLHFLTSAPCILYTPCPGLERCPGGSQGPARCGRESG